MKKILLLFLVLTTLNLMAYRGRVVAVGAGRPAGVGAPGVGVRRGVGVGAPARGRTAQERNDAKNNQQKYNEQM